MKKRIAVIAGTRPEIIKMAPVVRVLKASSSLEPWLVATGQHKEMAETAFRDFELVPDIDLHLMQAGQTPNSFLSRAILELEKLFSKEKIAAVLVQGDTTSALAGAITAFHQQIPVGHVEAGLRTHNLKEPFPEEMNRSAIGRMARFHFVPTANARQNLADEGITEGVFITGNTVIDAMLWMSAKLRSGEAKVSDDVVRVLASGKEIVLVTGHRRENFDEPLVEFCNALSSLAKWRDDISIVYPVHLNPKVSVTVHKILGKQDNVHLLPPVDYPSMIALMQSARLIITDSGGIQEEAPTFSVPVLVTRRSTERPEAIEFGFAELVDLSNGGELFSKASSILSREKQELAKQNPFGNGQSAEKIAKILEQPWSFDT